jgi:alanine racemase
MADIDLNAIHRNLKTLQLMSKTEVIPVLKADAYGHGLIPMARFLRSQGIQYMAVATLGEALLLRQAGDKGRILAWLYDVKGAELVDAFKQDLDIALFDSDLDAFTRRIPPKKRIRVTVFVDTGLNRSGIPFDQALAVCCKVAQHPRLKLVGLMSHFASANLPKQDSVHEQLSKFRTLRKKLAALGILPEMVHIANTGACLNYDVSDFTHARTGRGLFGLAEGLEPAATVWSRIIQVKHLPKGAGVGYNAEFVTPRPMHIVVAPVGYADVLPRDVRHLYVNGTPRRVLGAVSMDQVVVEGQKSDKVGDKLTLFSNDTQSIEQIGFSIEISCKLSNPRIHRRYV